MEYMKQFGIIISISFLGETLAAIVPFPVPGSIYGLLILFISLWTGILPLEKVEKTGDFLIAVMPLMFIPAGVGLMKEWQFLADIWLPFVVILIVTTVLVMAVTGRVTQWMLRKKERGKR